MLISSSLIKPYRLNFDNDDFIYNITLPDLVDYFQPFVNFSKTGVMMVEMLCATTVMANKKL